MAAKFDEFDETVRRSKRNRTISFEEPNDTYNSEEDLISNLDSGSDSNLSTNLSTSNLSTSNLSDSISNLSDSVSNLSDSTSNLSDTDRMDVSLEEEGVISRDGTIWQNKAPDIEPNIPTSYIPSCSEDTNTASSILGMF